MARSRHLIGILREVCAAEGIDLVSFCDDWVHRLERGKRVAFVFGYDFSINSATAQLVAKDKAATYAVLDYAGVPAVEHRLFHTPTMAEFVPSGGNWAEMLKFLQAHPQGIVCKPNEGTGGNDVWRVCTLIELEGTVHRLLQRHRTLCLSPFVERAAEFRVIVVDDICQLVYEKVRPVVVGDGRSTVRKLLALHSAASQLATSRGGEVGQPDYDAVPAVGEHVLLNWRHNLGQGSRPALLVDGDPRLQSLDRLARSAASALGLRAASIDILEADRLFTVLEANAGIMMEHLAGSDERLRETARAVYRRIILGMMS